MLKTIFSSVTGFLGGIQTYLIVGAICLAAGAGGALYWSHISSEAGQVQTAKATVKYVLAASNFNMTLGSITIAALDVDKSHTNQVAQEIPLHVTPQIDAAYPVPLGFVRVFNNASHGPIPGPTAGSDADPSGVPLSDVAGAHNADEGTLDVCRTNLTAWWSWYDGNAVLWNKAGNAVSK